MLSTIGVFCRPLRNGQPDLAQVKQYVDAVEANGAHALLLTLDGGLTAQHVVDKVDGLLLPGGAEVDPALYGAQRTWKQTEFFNAAFDRYEAATLQLALPMGMPVLGICRGMQLLNVATGGTLHQDIARDLRPRMQGPSLGRGQAAVAIEHQQVRLPEHRNDKLSPSHEIRLEAEVAGRAPILRHVLGSSGRWVNSTHHQCLDQVSPYFAVAARATDGVIESIESRQSDRVWGIQSHPERQRLVDARFDDIFRKLANDAADFAAQRSKPS